jgi:thiol:disulfide interchange protein
MFLDGLKKGMRAPDPGWLPYVKIMFGFFLLLVLAGLSAIIALGHVKAETSFGLDIILGGLLTLSGGFAGWAFRDSRHTGKPDEINQTGEEAEEQAHANSK